MPSSDYTEYYVAPEKTSGVDWLFLSSDRVAKWNEFVRQNQDALYNLYYKSLEKANEVKNKLNNTGQFLTSAASDFGNSVKEKVNNQMTYVQQEMEKQAQYAKAGLVYGLKSSSDGIEKLGENRRNALNKLTSLSSDSIEKTNGILDKVNQFWRSHLVGMASRLESPSFQSTSVIELQQQPEEPPVVNK